MRRGDLLPLVAAVLAGAACAHRAEHAVLHHRELVGVLPPIPGERTHFAYAEVREEDDAAPRLHVSLLAPDGSRQTVVHALGEDASACAARVRAGESLAEILPAYMELGLKSAPPPELPVTLGPPLEGMVLRLEPLRSRRFPQTHLLLLESEGARAEIQRFFVPEGGSLRLAALLPDAAAVELRSRTPAGIVQDVRAVDLLAGARRLFVAQARRALDAGHLEEAAVFLARAEILGAPDEGEFWFETARLRALSGAAPVRVLEALSRAIPHEPALYRMRARTDSAFARLKDDDGFVEVVAPRPLPGRPPTVHVVSE